MFRFMPLITEPLAKTPKISFVREPDDRSKRGNYTLHIPFTTITHLKRLNYVLHDTCSMYFLRIFRQRYETDMTCYLTITIDVANCS